jgi:hypothetical protein
LKKLSDLLFSLIAMDSLRLISKSIKIEGTPFGSSHQRNQIFLKSVAFFLLIGLAYRFLITNSTVSPVPTVRSSPESLPPDPSGLTAITQTSASVDSPANITTIASQNGKRSSFSDHHYFSLKFNRVRPKQREEIGF